MIAWLVGHLATARTFLGVFKGPCLVLGLLSFVAGGALGAWVGHRVASGEVARAEAKIKDLELKTVTAERDQLKHDMEVREEIRREYQSKLDGITTTADDIRRRIGAVRLCRDHASSVPMPTAASGTSSASESGQPPDIGPALVQLAERCDRQAEQLNALIAWLARQVAP